MIELFAALGFAEGPRLRSKSRSRPSPGRELPTPAELNGPFGPGPLGRDSHPLRPSRPLAASSRRGPSLSPRFHETLSGGAGNPADVDVLHVRRHMPATGQLPSAECGDHDSPTRLHLSDRTPGLLSRAERRRSRHPVEDYSDEPPSNRTSHSHGIRLYGSASWREVNPAPLDRLVRPVLPGDAAHLEDVSNAPRS